jgi:hypothetical protein
MYLLLTGTVLAQNPWGTIIPPPGVSTDITLIGTLIANLIRLLIVAAGIYAVINFILAGYGFMSAGGDPKRVADAWAKIWQTILGLIVVVGAYVIASVVSRILFGDAGTIFRIYIYGP